MSTVLAIGNDLLAQAATGHTIGSMLWLAIVFFVIALVAWGLGAGGVAGMSAGIGRALLWVCLVLAIVFLVLSLMPRFY